MRAGRILPCVRWVPTLAVSFLVAALPAEGARQVELGRMTIRLFSTATYERVVVDRPPTQQMSKGDVLVVESTLRNAIAQFGRPKGVVVGFDSVLVTIRSPTDADVTVASKLPGGDLRARGRTRLGGKQTYPVTGGTGTFAEARGTGESIALTNRWGSGSRLLKVYRLRLP